LVAGEYRGRQWKATRLERVEPNFDPLEVVASIHWTPRGQLSFDAKLFGLRCKMCIVDKAENNSMEILEGFDIPPFGMLFR
jgi:hypothetical protein